MSSRCPSCGMPLDNPKIAKKSNDGITYCQYCVNNEGNLRSFDEVLSGTSQYLMDNQNLTKIDAEKMAREMLQKMPAWQEY